MSDAAKTPAVTRLGLAAYSVALAVVVIDQLSKAWILGPANLPALGQIEVLPPFFNLTMVRNPGVSFGLLKAWSGFGIWALVAFSALVVLALAVWARRIDRLLPAAALGLIMGGAIGNNLIDRVRFGVVTDFLDFTGLYFPWVFNVADSAITVGVILLLIDSVFAPKPVVQPDP